MKVKFMQYYVTNGTDKARISYSIDNRIDGRKCVTLYSRDYGRELEKIFPRETQNDTDIMTDYFEKSRMVIFENHPLYTTALQRAQAVQQKRAEKYLNSIKR